MKKIICPVCHNKYDFNPELMGKKIECSCGCSWILTSAQIEESEAISLEDKNLQINKFEPEDHEECSQQITQDIIHSVVAKYLKPSDGDIMRKALEFILEEKRVSTSFLQRRLGIGYNKSAELIDELECRGVISAPLQGTSKRNVLILKELGNTITKNTEEIKKDVSFHPKETAT